MREYWSLAARVATSSRRTRTRKRAASGQMQLTVTPSFTGKLRIEARLVVSANLGAAAGSAMALPDIEGLLKDVLIHRRTHRWVS